MRQLVLILTAFIFAKPFAWSYVEGQFKPSEYRTPCPDANPDCLEKYLNNQQRSMRGIELQARTSPVSALASIEGTGSQTHDVVARVQQPTYQQNSGSGGNRIDPMAIGQTVQGLGNVMGGFKSQKPEGSTTVRVCGYKRDPKDNKLMTDRKTGELITECKNTLYYASTKANGETTYYLSPEEKNNDVNAYKMKCTQTNKDGKCTGFEAVPHGLHTQDSLAVKGATLDAINSKMGEMGYGLTDPVSGKPHMLQVYFNDGRPAAINDYVDGSLNRHFFIETTGTNGEYAIQKFETVVITNNGHTYVNQKYFDQIGTYLPEGNKIRAGILANFEQVGLYPEMRAHIGEVANRYNSQSSAYEKAVFYDETGNAFLTDRRGYIPENGSSNPTNLKTFVPIENLRTAQLDHRQIGWSQPEIAIKDPNNAENTLVQVRGYVAKNGPDFVMSINNGQNNQRIMKTVQVGENTFDAETNTTRRSFDLNLKPGDVFKGNGGTVELQLVDKIGNVSLGNHFLQKTEKGKPTVLLNTPFGDMQGQLKLRQLPGDFMIRERAIDANGNQVLIYDNGQGQKISLNTKGEINYLPGKGYPVDDPTPAAPNDPLYRPLIKMDIYQTDSGQVQIYRKPVSGGNQSFIRLQNGGLHYFKDSAEEAAFIASGGKIEIVTPTKGAPEKKKAPVKPKAKKPKK